MTEAATGFGKETVDVGGFLQDLDDRCGQQCTALTEVGSQTATLSDVSARMSDAVQQMAQTAEATLALDQTSVQTIGETRQNSQVLAETILARGEDTDRALTEIELRIGTMRNQAKALSNEAVHAK